MKTNRLAVHRFAVQCLLLAVMVAFFTAASSAQIAVGISVRVGPPALPVYAQPLCPGPGYYWTPGYWAWNDVGGYYWVPGTWVVAPVGMLWTPGYWGWGGGFYAWHGGYWGPHVGFYGGINYGYGYGGVGFVGGEWRGGGFYYNRAVSNVSVTNVTNVYNKTVIVNNTTTTSYNGGTGGIEARPTPQEEAAANEPHTAPLAAQAQHEQLASQNHENFASVNQGRPAVAATARAGDFSSRSAIPARAAGGEYHAPAMSPQEARVPSTPASRPGGTSTPATKSSDGFRPFTPPNSSNSRNASPSGTSTGTSNGVAGQPSSPAAKTSGTNSSSGETNNSYKPASSQPPNKPPKANTSKPPKPHKSTPPPAHKPSSGERFR
jgi:YXWGXW repeat-containing protein